MQLQPARIADTGSRWQLTDAEFGRWWNMLNPADRDEYLLVHDGNARGARMVCALDYLTNVEQRDESPDVILQAYCIAAGFNYATESKNNSLRYEARHWYEDPGVQRLYANLKGRARTQAFARVRTMMVSLLEDCYEDYRNAEDPKARREARRDALDYGIRYVKAEGGTESQAQQKRFEKLLKQAMEIGQQRKVDKLGAPSLNALPAFIEMVRSEYGDEGVEVIRAALPAANDD